MQINVPPIPSFNVPNTTGTVVGVVNVGHARPILEEGDQGSETGGGGPGPGPGPGPGSGQREPALPAVPAQRRDDERRSGQDRRRQQIPVLLDTRVGERRKTQRREEDPPPPAVDFRV